MNHSSQSSNTKPSSSSDFWIYVQVLLYPLLLLIAVFILPPLLHHYVFINVLVSSDSMEETLHQEDKLIASRLSYHFRSPKRGEVIAFFSPDSEEEITLKRIIALPGETIEGREGNIYIDGTLLKEDYVKEPASEDFGPYSVPKNHYFCMGDNRNNSLDSRHWQQIFISKDKIIGPVLVNSSQYLYNIFDLLSTINELSEDD